MAIVDTATASNNVLDWGLCKAIGKNPNLMISSGVISVFYADNGVVNLNTFPFTHSNTNKCTHLVEKYGIVSEQKDGVWTCKVLDVGSESHYVVATGETLAVAAARCVVLLELGKTFECDDRLLGEQM